MSNSILEKKWTRWYPEKIYLKNIQKNKNFLFYSHKFTKEDFCKENFFSEKTESEIDAIKIKEYEIGFKKGLLKGQQDHLLFENKLKNLFFNFETSLTIFENALCSQLLKTVLKIASYVIGKKIDIDESILINYIKKIIDKDGIFLKKPQLIIHSKNKKLIEKNFKEFLNIYKWTLVCDDSIDINGCKIKSEDMDIDATVDARWKEVCRLICSEEY